MLTHIGTQSMETERLFLRKFTMDDAQNAFNHWAGDPSVQTDYGEPVYSSLDETKELLQKYIQAYESPACYRWAIDLKHGEGCIGQTAFFLVDSKNEFCEIEYCIGKAFQNKGYISEAVKAIVDYGFAKAHFHRIQVSCRSVNAPSKRVIEKCGFTYEGNLRGYFNHLGQFQDRLYYSILRSEWEKRSRSFA